MLSIRTCFDWATGCAPGSREITERLGVPSTIAGFGSVFVEYFMEGPIRSYDDLLRNDADLFVRYRRELIARGVFELPINLKRNHVMFTPHRRRRGPHAGSRRGRAAGRARGREPMSDQPLPPSRVALAADRIVRAEHAVVSAQHPAAAQAGIEILQAGGNVVDAAIAAVFAATVADVGRTGIGGYGGHLVYHDARSGETWLVDFPTYAPLAADGCAIVDTGPLAVTVPAVVGGLAAAHEHFGTLPWADLLAPAIRLARDGIVFPSPGRDQVFDDAPRFKHVCRDHARLRRRLGGEPPVPAGPGRDARARSPRTARRCCTRATSARHIVGYLQSGRRHPRSAKIWRDTHPKSVERRTPTITVSTYSPLDADTGGGVLAEFSADLTR